MKKEQNDARTQELFFAGVSIGENVKSLNLSDDEAKIIIAHAFGPHLVTGYQQQQAGRATTEKKAAASRANGKKGGWPKGVPRKVPQGD